MPSFDYDVIVIGARRRRPDVRRSRPASAAVACCVIERNGEPGKKILISGGGRCNFTNLDAAPENFLSAQPAFLQVRPGPLHARRLHRAGRARTASPTTRRSSASCSAMASARQIVDMLLDECARGRREVHTAATVERDGRATKRFALRDRPRARSAPSRWSSPPAACRSRRWAPPASATSIARQFGHSVCRPRPALVPLTFSGQ